MDNYQDLEEGSAENKQSILVGSAIEFCGRKWHFGAEDLVVPSCCRALIHVAMFIAILAIYHSAFPDYLCSDDRRMHMYIKVAIGLYITLSLLDVATIVSGCTTTFLKPNRTMVVLIYIRMVVFAFHVVFNIVGTVLVFSTLSECLDSDSKAKMVSQAIVLLNWFVVGMTICAVFLGYNSSGDSEVSQDRCEQCLSYLLCVPCWKNGSALSEREPDAFSVIAKTLKQLFSDLRGIVVSDVAMGLLLIRALQERQRKLGKKFYAISPAEQRRLQAASPSRPGAAGPADGNPAQLAHRGIQPDLLPQDAERDGVDGTAADLAHRGIQPGLNPQDVARLEEARYYVGYALGAYGWPLYVFMNPGSSCSLCGCCLPLTDQQVGDLVGTNCCHCSVKAFLLRSQIPSTDLLHANLLTDFTQVVYYVCVDRVKKTLVIALRGTMSLQDAMTDAFAVPDSLEKYGLPGIGHAGITRAAAWVRQDIKQKGIVDRFLKENPDYGVRVVGHSLGAGTAALLSLIIKQDYPSLQCYSYAPPLLVDYKAAKKCSSFITSIVYSDDLISRLSLVSLRKLKDQMKWCFNQQPPAKWKVFLTSLHKLDLYAQNDKLFDFDKANQVGEQKDEESDDEGDSKEDEHLSDQSISLTFQNGHQNWPSLYLPGRIFHMVRDQTPGDASSCGCCSSAPKRAFVYPASQHGFQELIVSTRMMADHMPNEYSENLFALRLPTRDGGSA